MAGTDYPVFSWLAEETPVPEPTVPGAVAEISAEPLDNQVVVSWSEAEGADHYRLARQTTGQSWAAGSQ